jgi:glucose-1-phosphate thymidylyltransferase
LKALILASGFGTRLYPITQDIPKGLLPFKGKPMINHVIDKISDDTEIYININRKFEPAFRNWQKDLGRKIELCVENVYSEKDMLGAIGSLDHWVKKLSIEDDLLVIASDNYFEFDLNDFISAFNGKNMLVAVYDVGERDKATQYGVVELENDTIVGLEEKPSSPRSSLIATACWIIPHNIFPYLHSFCLDGKKDNLGNFISYVLNEEDVFAYRFNESWIDIGSPEIYLAHARK